MYIRFDAAETAALKSYVYVYSDPRNESPFYVGKGKGNRAFEHLDERSDHEKVLRIQEIRAAGFEPRIEILAFGLDDETALKVEAAAIDLIGFGNLTNRVLGHGASKYGRMPIDTVHARLAAKPLTEIKHEVAIIRINASVERARKHLAHRFDGQSDESAIALYDATRGTWVVSETRRATVKYALASVNGIVREVYEIAKWVPGGSTMYLDPSITGDPDRWEFVGKVAEPAVRDVYRFRSVSHLFPVGDMYPVRYFGPDSRVAIEG